ncbi:MAG: radical SAM protein, partial [Candidatus Riflebacteria bacterium]
KVLLVNPAKPDGFSVNRIHMGFALFSEILSRAGHIVQVLDYAFLSGIRRKVKPPALQDFIRSFSPDVIGVSVFSYQYDECLKILDSISAVTESPVVLGGPHITMFPEDFASDTRVSYLVRGEAESIIVELVERAVRKPVPTLIEAPNPHPSQIPPQKLDTFLGSEFLECYQIQLSRGCPFKCSFCNVQIVAGRKVRARELDVCLEQIAQAVAAQPSINTITVTDDCPNFDKPRFKDFLRRFASMFPGLTLTVDNMRADLLDEEMIILYTRAGGKNLCLGTESGDPEVFAMVTKGETLDDVVKTSNLVRKHNLQLGLCFVIGLPGDTLERHQKSIALAKELNPDYVFWNMCVPWPGTGIYEWFLKNGEIGDVRNFSTLITPSLDFDIPRAYSPEFPVEQRIKAWIQANLETFSLPFLTRNNFRSFPRNLLRLFSLGMRYGLFLSSVKFLVGLTVFKFCSILRTKFLRRFKRV